ncbi:G protein-coupled receptor-related domain containing protein [Babesia gibsoni]|uniref:G protein-coupled receptor-related domain containing protein n=1 Tax=Babesia gibsoni TaxID=33632 RepID=A0AAD8PEV9_BABGI|nr:G protein-coupled receptor-related domain containing protein [Babesia gibsoni]
MYRMQAVALLCLVSLLPAPSSTQKPYRHQNADDIIEDYIVKTVENVNYMEPKLNPWVKAEEHFAYPFREARTCWPGYDGITSMLQMEMDRYCQSTSSSGITRCARCSMKDKLNCYCVDLFDIDYTVPTRSCVNNCNQLVSCFGETKHAEEGKLVEHWFVESNLHKYCVTSELQQSLDMLCRNQFVARYSDGNLKCHHISNINFKLEAKCWDECGNIVTCLGAPINPSESKTLQIPLIPWRELLKNCPCNEVVRTQPHYQYTGCQNVSVHDNECLNWDADSIPRSLPTHLIPALTGNFCRFLPKYTVLKCYTNKNQLEDCLPRSTPSIVSQPGIIFDLWLKPYIPGYTVKVKFQALGSVCGAGTMLDNVANQSYEFQPYDIYSGRWSTDVAKQNVDSHPSKDGSVNYSVVKGFVALGNRTGNSLICACVYTKVYAPHPRKNACTENSDYTLLVGVLTIKGSTMPKVTIMHRNVNSVSISDAGALPHGIYSMISDRFIERDELDLYGSFYLMPLQRYIDADHLEEKQNTALIGVKRDARVPNSPHIIPRIFIDDDVQHTVINVSKMGEYMLLHRQTELSGAPSSDSPYMTFLQSYSLTGFDVNYIFTLMSVETAGINNIPQSILFRSWKILKPPLAVILCIESTSDTCSSKLGISRRISPTAECDISKGETIWRASGFSLNKAWETVKTFDVFAFVEPGKLLRIGKGEKSKYVDHEMAQLDPNLTEIPNNISTYTLHDEWDFLHLQITHFMDENFRAFAEGSEVNASPAALLAYNAILSDQKFSNNEEAYNNTHQYPKVISFWSMKDSSTVMIFLMKPNGLTPSYLGSFDVDHPISFEVLIQYDKIHAIVLSEGTSVVDKYELLPYKNYGLSFHLSHEYSTCQSEYCVDLKSPTDMKVINYQIECQQGYLVIVTDAAANCIVLLSDDLRELDRLCHETEGINRIIQEPTRVSCTSVSNPESCISFTDNSSQIKTANCFVTQKYSGMIIWIEVHLDTLIMTIQDAYSGYTIGGDIGDTNASLNLPKVALKYPIMVETVSYPVADFVYLIQAESSFVHTFMAAKDVSNAKLMYYGRTQLEKLPFSTFVYIKSVQMTEKKPNSSVDNDYLILLRQPQIIGYNPSNSGYVTIFNVKDTIRVEDFDYKLPDWLVTDEEIEQTPHFLGPNTIYSFLNTYDLDVVNDNADLNYGSITCVDKGATLKNHNVIGRHLDPMDWKAGELEDNVIAISPTDGTLRIHLKKIHQLTLKIRILALGPIDAKCIIKTFSVACKNGYYYDNNADPKLRGCKMCEPGSYNSLKMIKKDFSRFYECTKCDVNESTLLGGSTSSSQCMCGQGYYLNSTKVPRCQPCPPGTWKSVVGSQGCMGGNCYKNSISTVTGSKTEEERQCSCFPGFYYKHSIDNRKECVPCEEGYYCLGGFLGKRTPCPVNTTTKASNIPGLPILASDVAKQLDDCICKAGYEPADPKLLNDPLSQEYRLKSTIVKELEVYGMGNHDVRKLICVPCKKDNYKDSKGSGKCIPCPRNSLTLITGARSVTECNKCAPGYYETNDPTNPCEICSPNHICIGSDPVETDMFRHRGKKLRCPRNAITIPPFDSNVDMINCLCDKGYYNIGENGMTVCEPVPKNTYKDAVGNVGPTECSHGSYTLSTGATSNSECVCGKGTYFDTARMKCTTCPAGKYCLGGRLPNGEHAPPMVCDDTYALTTTEGASGPGDCVCKPGYYPASGSMGVCVECPVNTYKAFTSNDECTACDEHSSTGGKTGATSREQCICAPGYYFNKYCKACGYRDKYCPGGFAKKEDSVNGEDVYETRAPESCPANTEIPPGVDTADSIESCKCAKGYAFVKRDEVTNQKICAPCAPGSYKSSVMDSSCNGLCTQNATSFPGAQHPIQCFCQRGYYYLDDGICAPCVEGAKCDGGLINMDERKLSKMDVVVSHTEHVKPVPIEGYYLDKINTELRKPDDWRFIKCPIKGACLGEKGCSESMTEYLCAECMTGYTNNFKKGALCTQCPNTLMNVLLLVAWYLGLLLVNIVMACLNVSAGFNRRSTHSIVIKIALNYGICMSVLNVVNFNDLALPEEIKSVSLRWFKMMYRENRVYYMSLDCLMQKWFGMNHANSFFYTMLFVAFLPVILLVVVTVLMWIILELFKIKRHSVTRSKLALLHQSRMQGMTYLSERLRDEYANERLFLIFRYIPLPGETHWVRFKHFLEDMIPIYVTVLFSVHGNTTSQMLSLLDCTFITLGQSVHSKYVLRPAMSIKCSLDPKMGYIPYFLLGMGGLIFWGFGIPFFSFLVLLLNRKKLYAPDVRMKYGFLHNGYQQDYWFWEAVVFTRKCLVLVIGSIVIVPSHNLSGSRIWMALSVAVLFLVMQVIYKPFDERDYIVLGRLETHSMIAWSFSLMFFMLAVEGEFEPHNNMYVLMFVTVLNSLFVAEVILELALAYCDNVRSHKRNNGSSLMCKFNRVLAGIAEHRKSREPLIYFNEVERTVDLVMPGTSSWYISEDSNRNFTLNESLYFVHILSRVMNFANMHMKLDIIPMDFPEFIARLTFAVNFHEANKKKAMDMVKSLARGNLNEIVNLSILQNRELRMQSSAIHRFPTIGIQTKEEHIVAPMLLFDQEVLTTGIPLSDFYMSFSIIKMKDPYDIVRTYTEFKVLREAAEKEKIEEQMQKVSHVEEILRRISNPDKKTKEDIFCSDEELQKERKKVQELENAIMRLTEDPLRALEEYEIDGFDFRIQRLGFERHNRPNVN